MKRIYSFAELKEFVKKQSAGTIAWGIMTLLCFSAVICGASHHLFTTFVAALMTAACMTEDNEDDLTKN